MKNTLILLIAILCINVIPCYGARTVTEFRAYSKQQTYNKATDTITRRNYVNHIDRCNDNTECFICVFDNSTDEWGYEYTIYTSGYMVKNIQTDYGSMYDFIKCNRQDGYYKFNSKAEAKEFAKLLRERPTKSIIIK